MPSWRPEDWKEIQRDSCGDCKMDKPQVCVICNIAFESGADFILESLRKRGYHFEKTMTFNGFYEGSGFTLRNLGTAGTFTFVPDDKE